MKVELEWRSRTGDAALVLKKNALPRNDLTIYVLDPAPADHNRRHRHRLLIEAMVHSHRDATQPTHLCLLGCAGPPLFSSPGSTPATRRRSLESLLGGPPVFGRWWTPTRNRIEDLQKEFAGFQLMVRLLLNHHQLLPIDWVGPSTWTTDTDTLVVTDDAIPDSGGCEVISWPEFDAWMRRSDTIPLTGYAPRIAIDGPRDAPLALAAEAETLGWTMVTEKDRRMLIHQDFRMSQGETAITLAILEGGVSRSAPLPYALFDGPSDRRNR